MAVAHKAQAQAQAQVWAVILPLLFEERVGVRSTPAPHLLHPHPAPLPFKGEGTEGIVRRQCTIEAVRSHKL